MRSKIKPTSPISAFLDTQHKKLYLSKLISTAKKMRATDVQQAQGTCLTMSLEFCLAAKGYGIPVELVMWPVKNDPDFCDHWAVRINQSQVIDLTRIQVDNIPSSEVVFEIADYPQNYQRPRYYRTAPLIDEYQYFREAYSDKLPPVLIKNLRKLMLKQDLDNVNHFKNFYGISSVLIAHLKFRLYFFLSQLEDRLRRRHDEIKKP